MFPIVFDNPILTREMRRRMRGKAMIYSLIAYVAILCIVTFFTLLIMYGAMSVTTRNSGEMIDKMKKIGETIFFCMNLILSVLVLIMAPAITASLITAERERGTADFLRVTTLPPTHFIVGSFLSTTLYVILLLGCALPVVTITLLFGGISPTEVMLAFGRLLLGSIILSSLGIYTSSIRNRTRTAQGMMIGVAILFVLFVWILPGIVNSVKSAYGLQSSIMFGQDKYLVFGLMLPDWLVAGLPFLLFSLVMLVAAGRKVYNIQNRPLAYWQYLLFFLCCMLGLTALFTSTTNKQSALQFWFGASLTLLFCAPLILNIHYVEVGGDNWRIHQRLRPLAVIDDSIVFLLLLIAGWWAASHALFATAGPMYARVADIFACTIVPPILFIALLGRLLAHRFYHRHLAFRILFTGIVIFWIVLPLLILSTHSFTRFPLGGGRDAIAEFSPFYSYFSLLAVDFVNAYSSRMPPLFRAPSWPGHFQGIAYLAFSIVLYLSLLLKNRHAQRELDMLEEGGDEAENVMDRFVKTT